MRACVSSDTLWRKGVYSWQCCWGLGEKQISWEAGCRAEPKLGRGLCRWGHWMVSLACSGQVVKHTGEIWHFFSETGFYVAQAGLNL